MSNESKIRQRAEIDSLYKWQLEDIYATDEAWEGDFAAAQDAIAAMPALQAGLAPTKESILAALRATDSLFALLDTLYSYARMRRDEDSRVATAQAMADRAESLAVRGGAATAFLRPALLEMPEALLRDCLGDSAFAAYDRTLEDVLRMRPHTLPAAQEALLAEAGEIGNAPQTIMTMLSEADMTFPQIRDEHGVHVDLTEGRFVLFLENRDGRVRKDAYETLLSTYGKFGNTIAAIYGSSVKNDVFHARARRFTSAREASLYENEIPVSVYDALLTAIDERIPAMNRYLDAKRKALGADALHMWDLYVDTVQGYDMKLTYEEAYALVLEALAPLGEDYVATLRDAKDAGWVDVFENAGKSTGAYSWGTYGTHPFVLLNFKPTLDGASTLAHELGHSMHTHMSNKAQPFAKAGYTLFAAEVASTVNEILLVSLLLSKHPERKAQASLLGTMLENFRTTVFRQALFATFEMETHAMQERGEPLTKEALCDAYYAINQRFYGGVCVVDDVVRNEWMRIPHFYRAFYVYQYATGFSAAVSIARRILREGAPAVEGYRKFLSAGGSLPPLDALRLAGVDMATPAPVREALDWFEEILAQFEAVSE